MPFSFKVCKYDCRQAQPPQRLRSSIASPLWMFASDFSPRRNRPSWTARP